MNGYVRILLFAMLLPGRLFCGEVMAGEAGRQDAFLPPTLAALFEPVDDRYLQESLQLKDTLEQIWTLGNLSQARKDTIVQAIEKLQQARFQPWPDIGYYLKVVVASAAGHQPDSLFSRWHQSLAFLLQHQTFHRTLNFMERSAVFLREQVLFESSSVKWTVKGGQWEFNIFDDQPWVVFSHADLTAFAHHDSTAIHHTSGRASLLTEECIGQGGTVTWKRVLLNPDKVFAQLEQYHIDLNVPSFQADSVLFYHLELFEEPLRGKLTERILAEVKPGDSQFPGFVSDEQFHELKEVFPGINYRGGFSMAGAMMLGTGTVDEPAQLDFLKEDSLFITARAGVFSIRQDRIVAERAAVSLYLAKDSIFHQELTLRYNHHQRELTLIRDERGSSRAPFFNTYHQMDMYCQALSWNLDQKEISLRMIDGRQNATEALFESNNYFNIHRYRRLQGIDEIHPLVRLSMFSRQVDTRSFPIADFARFLKRDPDIVKSELLNLSFLGFLSYDVERERVTLREKLFLYLGANAARNDYDVISILSMAPVNGTLDIDSYKLQIYGVDHVTLSNARNVVIHPLDQQVVMYANRDLHFAGRIESGLFNFYGKEFFFDYEDFRINLMDTDSMSFRVRSFEPDSRGRYEFVQVETVLERINGELLVDHPGNKSGRLPYARFPVFNSNNESFVYFDRDKVQQGIYSREDIYFRIVPFTIDSLDHASTDNLAFDGVFHSKGIFPDFNDFLTVQADYSLGFNTDTPEEGFPVYDGLAWYHGPIRMSQEGLTTVGNLHYVGADIKAYKMVMFPDSVSGLAETFIMETIREPVSYPSMEASMPGVLLLKKDNKMLVSTRNEPMLMFDHQASLRGSVELDPQGVTAKGEISLFDATIVADHFTFGAQDFASRESMMGVQSWTSSNNAFVYFGYQAAFDMVNYQARFVPGVSESGISFPSNHLSGKNYNVAWDMKNGSMDLVINDKQRFPLEQNLSAEQWLDVDFSGYHLQFTNNQKQALKFFAPDLAFDMQTNTLHAQGVNLVRVADVAVFPNRQELFVEEGAQIRELTNAVILANATDHFHRFYDAEVDILSLSDYKASGSYDYVDENRKQQTILFHEIQPGQNSATLAQARIAQEQQFMLSPYFAFMGKVELVATNPVLTFDGFSRISAHCPMPEPQWFGFRGPVDPARIYIPVQEPLRSHTGATLTMGIMMAGDSTHIYPGIFTRPGHWSDVKIVSASGYITYDHQAQEYRVSTMEKLANTRRHEDYIRFNTQECIVQGQGNVDLGSDLGQFDMNPYGTVTQDLNSNTVDYDLVLGMDFFFADAALAHVQQSFTDKESLEPVSLNTPKMVTYLQSKMGEREAFPFVNDISQGNGLRRLPDPLQQTMVLADVKLRWNQATQALLSVGPIGIGHVNKKLVGRYANGFFELRKQRGGDVLTFILTPDETPGQTLGAEWFYFTYSRGVLQTIAGTQQYNQGITEMRQRHRQLRVERGQEPFVFMLATQRRPFDFYDHMMRFMP
ncbi:MAG: hypothetical protein R6U64_09665 [Bacteroidales bacterium]